MSRKPRPDFPGTQGTPDIASMIRVDHAGEYGAVRIYEGQLAVLGGHGSTARAAIAHMAEQEQRHLTAFDQLVIERHVRPTLLAPLWQVTGFVLGAATAMLGEKVAMACTAAVEEVIDEHYAAQVSRLGDSEPKLRATIEAFRAEEVAHRDTALAHGANEAPGYPLLSTAIKAGCRLAIKLSEKL